MNLHLQPRQFLMLYNCIKKYELEFMNPEDEEVFDSVKKSIEDAIIGAFENLEARAQSSGFDKWVKSETNKIQGLEEELKKIKEIVPREELVKKFVPLSNKTNKHVGRPKKSK